MTLNNLDFQLINDLSLEFKPGFLKEPKKDDEVVAGQPRRKLFAFDTDLAKEASPDVWKSNRVFKEAIRAMGQLMELRDPYTAGHQERVSCISIKIAQFMDLPPNESKVFSWRA